MRHYDDKGMVDTLAEGFLLKLSGLTSEALKLPCMELIISNKRRLSFSNSSRLLCTSTMFPSVVLNFPWMDDRTRVSR